ncbi:mucin-2-like [Centruroides sculpturatus]|uniref:mucin-2-like n=1 Tax=Centruroides sculpturatus TaxID=218467 RepID=UPI000C6CF15C|nr:mucin-2-like [Centruroides sculpturatus]
MLKLFILSYLVRPVVQSSVPQVRLQTATVTIPGLGTVVTAPVVSASAPVSVTGQAQQITNSNQQSGTTQASSIVTTQTTVQQTPKKLSNSTTTCVNVIQSKQTPSKVPSLKSANNSPQADATTPTKSPTSGMLSPPNSPQFVLTPAITQQSKKNIIFFKIK